MQFIFALYAYIIIHTHAPTFLAKKEVYYEVFSPYLKFAIASSISVLIGSWVNIILLSKLSEYVGGKYFALRSFIASTLGELLVTVISMLIANINRMDIHTLTYMIFCCFFIKTIISFIAIWPAALIVYQLENQNEYDISFKNIKNPFLYIKQIVLAAWTAKSYVYSLEVINLETQKVNLYYKGTRGIIHLPLSSIIANEDIINKSSAHDAAHIGYYFGVLNNKSLTQKPCLIKNGAKQINQSLKKGGVNIVSINRDGKLNIEDTKNQINFTKKPIELYKNQMVINKFSPSQSLYIGYLASLEERNNNKQIHNKYAHLRLVKY